jgi:lipoprotein-anchoring transpeptidase ErfK/SrfK
MRREDPSLPAYVPPGPSNPLGVRAIYLGWSEYRIHGTNMPWSIGRASSSGCIRMHNADVIDLFERVHIGAPVHVLR